MTREEIFMQQAIAVGLEGMRAGKGGPFGCVIVQNNQVIACGCNTILATNDPTAHAEVVAIRQACAYLKSFQLTGCEMYASCEPCPMCMGAIYWARPDKVYFANTKTDAAAIGFDDAFIYEEMARPMHLRKLSMQCLEGTNAIEMFAEWQEKGNKTLY